MLRLVARKRPRWSRGLATLPPTIRTLLSLEYVPEGDVNVHGWVKSLRKQKNFSFVDVTDGSHSETIQAIVPSNALPSSPAVTVGASVRLSGQLVKPDARRSHRLELHAQSCDVLGSCDSDAYPIQKNELSVEHLRDHCHLRARYPRMASTLRLRDQLFSSIHDYCKSKEFTNVHTPIITSNDCEGAGETFEVYTQSDYHEALEDPQKLYFDKRAFLTVSHQLHLEAITHSFPRVYSLAPCFRAEKSQTSRHLSEFYMLEAEVVFLTSTTPLMDLVEDCVKYTLRRATQSQDFALLWAGKEEALGRCRFDAKWHRVSYTDAIKALKDAVASGEVRFGHKVQWGADLQSEHERYLVEQVFGGPVFVHDYPRKIKPFYMLPNGEQPGDKETVANFDLLVPSTLELCGGSLRIHDLAQLEEALDQQRMLTSLDGGRNDGWDWYLDLRKYGSAPHGGFGLGFDRLLSWITGAGSVRDVVPMPRWAGRMLL